MEIETLPLDALIPYARNSRTHSPEQVAQIAASIREFGFTNPVLIDADGGIIAGHGRVMGARQLGLSEAPCIRLSHLTEAQKRAYVIADNKIALNAGWDTDMLRIELEDLQSADFDLDVLGFNADELGGILGTDTDPLDAMPALPEGDKEPFQQMTFTLHDEQAETVKRAMAAARAMGPFADTGNENGNGNALARICETFITQHG
jgi:ParB family transcriptional regulator, chromosome partitioning protein